jgi:hypothetical protein
MRCMGAKRGRAVISRAWQMLAEIVRAKNVSRVETKSKGRTEIHIETHETVVVRPFGRTHLAWCRACGIEVSALTPEAAAVVAGTTPREIYRRIESGLLHAVEFGDGATLVCSNMGLTPQNQSLDGPGDS